MIRAYPARPSVRAGVFRSGGTAFSAGATDCPPVLGDARDRQVERITRNVLDRLDPD